MIIAGNGRNLVLGDSGEIYAAAATRDASAPSRWRSARSTRRRPRSAARTRSRPAAAPTSSSAAPTATSSTPAPARTSWSATTRRSPSSTACRRSRRTAPSASPNSVVATIETTARTTGGADTIYGEADDDVLIGGAAGDRIDGGAQRDLIFGDNVRLDRTATLRRPDEPALPRPCSAADPVRRERRTPRRPRAVAGATRTARRSGRTSAITLLDHDDATADGRAEQLRQRLHRRRRRRRRDLRPARQRHDPGRRLDRPRRRRRRVPHAGAGDPTAPLTIRPSVDNRATDGDDYIEGGGGNDVIFGNLGQDDIVGGSSDLFSLTTPAQRPDGADLIFGGAGTRDRPQRRRRHDRRPATRSDADAILGDNGNIFRARRRRPAPRLRLPDVQLRQLRRRPRQRSSRARSSCSTTRRAAPTSTPARAATDIGAADEIHGESGDDFVYGDGRQRRPLRRRPGRRHRRRLRHRLDLRRHRRRRHPRRRRPHLRQPQQRHSASRSTASPRSRRRSSTC